MKTKLLVVYLQMLKCSLSSAFFHLEPKPEHLTLTALACDAAQHDAHSVLLCIPSMVHPEKLQGEANARRYLSSFSFLLHPTTV